MSVTDNPPNNSSPSLSKLILTIFVCLFVCVIVPIILGCISLILLIAFLERLLNYIHLPEGILSFIMMFLPLIGIVVIAFVLTRYMLYIPTILDRIPLDIRKILMDYLTYKDWKIGFYRIIAFFKTETKSLFSVNYYFGSEFLPKMIYYGQQISLLILFISIPFLVALAYTSYAGQDFFQVNILESQTLLNFVDTHNGFYDVIILIFNIFIALVTVMMFFMTLSVVLEMIPMSLIFYFFSSKKGFVDTSDIPIYFTKLAIQQLETVDFLESSDLQDKKNKISNYINDSLRCIKVNKESGSLDYMNFCFQKCRCLLNVTAFNDIIFRLNSLDEDMNRTLIKINHMNSLEDKNEIMKDLEKYLKVIENKDLSKIDPKEFVTEGLTIDKALSFISKNVILPVILVILTQKLI